MSKALELLKEIKSYNNKPLRIMPSDKKFNEAIAELEALQQPKSCEGCKWNDIPFPSNQFHCDECKHAYSYYNDNFEPK